MAKIVHPFQVQFHISEKYHFGCSDSSATGRIAYVELRGHEENYGAVKVDLAFETY